MTIKQHQNQTQQQQRSTMMIIATVVTVLFPSMAVAFTIISPPSSFSSSITHAISRRHSNNNNNNNNNIKNCYLPQQQQQQQHGLKNLDLYSSSIDDDTNDDTETTVDTTLDDDEEEVVEEVDGNDDDDDDNDMSSSSVRTPLKFIGSYPCLGLKFPNLSTESQREKNITTGIALDFVLDTASNINTIQGPVAQQLQLEKLNDKRALPGVSSSGPIAGGDTFLLGDSQLEEVLLFSPSSSLASSSAASLKDTATATATATTDTVDHNDADDDEKKIILQEKKELPFEFMQQLTASVLPGIANPGSAGLLGLAFFYCFEGGVEFRWGGDSQQQQLQQQQEKEEVQEPKLVDGMVVPQQGSSSSSSILSQSSITFHGDENEKEFQRTLSELTRVKIAPIPLTQLPTVRIKINNVEMVALLDTGSPVTVLNERAAKAAGIQTTKKGDDDGNNNNKDKNKKNSWNPFASVVDKFKEAQATAEAASKGDVLMIGGIDGQPTNLYRSINDGISISLVADENDDDDVPFGDGGDQDSNSRNTVYVGNIPGLAALNGIGVDSPPAVVLGLDILRKRPSMLLRARNNEVYF